jgi:hypothetical protein
MSRRPRADHRCDDPNNGGLRTPIKQEGIPVGIEPAAADPVDRQRRDGGLAEHLMAKGANA